METQAVEYLKTDKGEPRRMPLSESQCLRLMAQVLRLTNDAIRSYAAAYPGVSLRECRVKAPLRLSSPEFLSVWAEVQADAATAGSDALHGRAAMQQVCETLALTADDPAVRLQAVKEWRELQRHLGADSPVFQASDGLDTHALAEGV